MLSKQLKTELSEHLKVCPGDSREVLELVTKSLADYESAVQAKRNSQAYNAVSSLATVAWAGLVHPKKDGWKGARIEWLLDAVWHQFPTGKTGQAECDLRMWEAFIELCKENPPNLEWIGNTRGDECVAWYIKYVQPKSDKQDKT